MEYPVAQQQLYFQQRNDATCNHRCRDIDLLILDYLGRHNCKLTAECFAAEASISVDLGGQFELEEGNQLENVYAKVYCQAGPYIPEYFEQFALQLRQLANEYVTQLNNLGALDYRVSFQQNVLYGKKVPSRKRKYVRIKKVTQNNNNDDSETMPGTDISQPSTSDHVQSDLVSTTANIQEQENTGGCTKRKLRYAAPVSTRERLKSSLQPEYLASAMNQHLPVEMLEQTMAEHLPESILESDNYANYLRDYLEAFDQELAQENITTADQRSNSSADFTNEDHNKLVEREFVGQTAGSCSMFGSAIGQQECGDGQMLDTVVCDNQFKLYNVIILLFPATESISNSPILVGSCAAFPSNSTGLGVISSVKPEIRVVIGEDEPISSPAEWNQADDYGGATELQKMNDNMATDEQMEVLDRGRVKLRSTSPIDGNEWSWANKENYDGPKQPDPVSPKLLSKRCLTARPKQRRHKGLRYAPRKGSLETAARFATPALDHDPDPAKAIESTEEGGSFIPLDSHILNQVLDCVHENRM